MGFKCAIIGLPNVGKSTIFNMLTKSNVKTENFPFCTIKPNIGIVNVPDIRLYQLSQIISSKKITPTTMQFIDVAGLIKNASKGEGLGNKFLNEIRESDAIAHVVRCFDNQDIIHINNSVDPYRDINIINTELILSDLENCERIINRIQKETNIINIYNNNKLKILKKCLTFLENGKLLNNLHLNQEELFIIKDAKFLTNKPTMYIANINQKHYNNNKYLTEIKKNIDLKNAIIISISAIIKPNVNNKIINYEYNSYYTESNCQMSELEKIIHHGYNLLNLKTFFTVGDKEIKAWTVKNGTTAKQASGIIHSDFEKGFIRVQIISFDDFIKYKDKHKLKLLGKLRSEGKKYIIQDGDICQFLFNI